MGQLLTILIIIALIIFWVILPIYRKITGTDIDSDLFGDDLDKRNEALGNLSPKTSEKKLLNIYKKTDDQEIKCKTIELSENVARYALLNTIEESYVGEENYLKEQAIKRISDKEVLKEIVFNTNCDFVRIKAMNKINDEDFFIDIVKSQTTTEIKLLAYDKIMDKALLKEFIQKETDSEILLKLIDKTGEAGSISEKSLLKLIKQTKDIMLIKKLMSGLKSNESFFKVAKSIKYKDVKFKAIENISDEDMLMELVQSDNGKEIKLAALNKIKNEDRLTEISKSASKKEVKLLAYQNICSEEKLKELILAEVDVDFLMSYFQANQDKIELIKDISISDASLPIKLLQFEKDFKNRIENTNILESLFTKDGLNNYAQIVSAKEEDKTIKDEITKKHKLIKQQCNVIIKNKDDAGMESKPESLIKMINIFISYKDLFASFNTADEIIQFLLLYERYSGIYDLDTYFYSERSEYLDAYDANNNLTDMGRYYDVELRHEKKGLDFGSAISIYDMLKETLNQKGWWDEALAKAWLDSISTFVDNKGYYIVPLFIRDLTAQLILLKPKSLSKQVLTYFVNADLETLKREEKDEGYITHGFYEYISDIKGELK